MHAAASTLFELMLAMRPRQWPKNLFVFAALIFTRQMTDPHAVALSVGAFVSFCLLSSSVYLLNDVADRERDRQHPVKRERPIAAGRLSVGVALFASLVLALVALGLAVVLGTGFAAVASIYLVVNLAYSFKLKGVVILDVMLVASGFLLRAWGGAVVLGVAMSNWLVLCTGLIALFLGFVKRRQELTSLGPEGTQRAILREYSIPFLDQMISIVTASTLLAYALYAFSSEVAEKLGTRWMGLTLPFVAFGIFRYLYLVHQRGEGENPSALVFTDRALLVNILLWAAAVVVALYLLN